VNDEPILPKAYYSIGDVCDLTGLKPHVLRYWETQFEALHPTKNRAGNRVYRPREVELVLLVKHLLYEEKFTIEGARQRLRDMRKGGGLAEERQEVAAPELVQVMKEELAHLHALLSLPEEGPIGPPPSQEGSTSGGAGANPGPGPGAPSGSSDHFPQLRLGVDEG
jgi:DNA-binding transcriptional MerR regulator